LLINNKNLIYAIILSINTGAKEYTVHLPIAISSLLSMTDIDISSRETLHSRTGTDISSRETQPIILENSKKNEKYNLIYEPFNANMIDCSYQQYKDFIELYNTFVIEESERQNMFKISYEIDKTTSKLNQREEIGRASCRERV